MNLFISTVQHPDYDLATILRPSMRCLVIWDPCRDGLVAFIKIYFHGPMLGLWPNDCLTPWHEMPYYAGSMSGWPYSLIMQD